MTGPKGRRDVITGLKAKGASVAYGSANADFLYSSGDAPITLYGKSGGDIPIGGVGNDTLDGGEGEDLMMGHVVIVWRLKGHAAKILDNGQNREH